jgi:hypothetical protein
VLDCGDEGELDRLPRDDHRTGLVLRRRDRLEQPIRIRLQPRKVARGQKRRGRIARRGHLRRQHPRRLSAKHVETCVRGDPVEPGPKREAPVRAEAGALAPSAEKRLLDEILGVLERAEHPIAMNLQLPAVALEESDEARLLARVRELLGGVHHRI